MAEQPVVVGMAITLVLGHKVTSENWMALVELATRKRGLVQGDLSEEAFTGKDGERYYDQRSKLNNLQMVARESLTVDARRK